MENFQESELILNPDGSIYHLSLLPEQLAENIFVVGDQERVQRISAHFDRIEHKVQNREFVTHTGVYQGKRITALSTGIGTDNIDIVINELDALVNIDLEKRIRKEKHTALRITRLGTSGAIQEDIPVDTLVASRYGLGFDGLLNFYAYDENILEMEMIEAFMKHTNWNERLSFPYIVACSDELMDALGDEVKRGITVTANGFYGPQGRKLRIPLAFPELNQQIEKFSFRGERITNFEMETSALFALGRVLGHQTLTICAIIANRVRGEYSKDYKLTVDNMISMALDKLTH